MRIEPEPYQLGLGNCRATVSQAGEPLDKCKLPRLDLGQGSGFGQEQADLLDRFARFGLAVRDGFASLLVLGQIAQVCLGHLVDEILTALQIVGNLANIVAIGLEPRFGTGHLGFAIEQQVAVAIRQIARNSHAGHRQDPE